MALDFPNSPTLNQTFTAPSGVIWTWDGAKWANGTLASVYAPVASPTFTGDPKAPTPTQGDSDTSIATTAFVQAAVATALHDTGRNLIHNPLFNIAQRGVGPFTTALVYGPDRWKIYTNLDTISVSQQPFPIAGLPADEEAAFYLSNAFTGNAGAAALNIVFQLIENVRRLSNKTVTVSFWAGANAGAPKLGVSLDQNFGTGGSPSAVVNGNGQSVTLSTTLVRYSLTFTVPSIAGKTLGTNGDHNTGLNFWFSSGATNATRSGNVGVQSGTINIWGVQLEIGSVATPLEKPDPRYDLANCYRFYFSGLATSYGAGAAGAAMHALVNLPAVMRATPTVVPTIVGSPGLTSPNVIAYTADKVLLTATMNTTSYGFDCSYSASADL